MALFLRRPASCRRCIFLSLRGQHAARVSKAASTIGGWVQGSITWQEDRIDICCIVCFMLQRQHAVHARLQVVY